MAHTHSGLMFELLRDILVFSAVHDELFVVRFLP